MEKPVDDSTRPGDPDRRDLLLFHFRSSDSGVYQDAAEVLGRELLADPGLRHLIEAYAARHGTGLEGPVTLDGVRGLRRLLLLRAAARAAWLLASEPKPEWEPEDPIAGSGTLPPDPRDLAVRLRAERILLDADPSPTRQHRCFGVIEGAADDPDRRWSRAALRRWIELFEGLAPGAPESIGAWTRLRDRILRGHPTTSIISARVENLALLDGLVRGLVHLPPDTAQQALGEGDGETRVFLHLRYRLWFVREHGHAVGLSDPIIPETLTWLHRWVGLMEGDAGEGSTSFDPGDRIVARRRALLRQLVAPLEDPAEWALLSPHRRALHAFHLLDVLAHLRDEVDELAVVARPLLHGEGHPADRLVLRLVEFEGEGAEAMVDPRFIHEGKDDGLLLALLPRGRSELLPVLADGVEHRLRLRLASDHDAHIERDLVRVAVRAPHPSFWTHLAGLVRGRSYPLAGGGEASLGALVEAAAGGALPVEEPRIERLDALGLEPARRSLEDFATLVDELEEFAGWINRDRSRCLSREAAGGEGAKLHELGVRLAEHVQALHRLGSDFGEDGASPDEIGQARSHVEALGRELLPLLPMATARALEGALHRLRGRLDEEADAQLLLEDVRRGETDPYTVALRVVPHPLDSLDGRGVVRAWRARALALWERALAEAMANGHESRVRKLIRLRGLEALLAGTGRTERLEGVRRWWFDRYALLRGLEVSRLMNRLDGAGRTGAGDLGRFLLSFSPLWLALLIGAVLMLDFGDAWKAMVEAEDLRGILITFVVGAGGALGYLAFELRRKSRPSPDDPTPFPVPRLLGFFGLCLGYTLAMTSMLWLLLSRTDEVVHGAWAPAHVVVWAGFALFVGVFFGMIAKE
jgi:hypothetical protein